MTDRSHTDIVIDTNVWVGSGGSGTPERETVETVLDGRARMYLTPSLAFEYEKQLHRYRVKMGLSTQDVVDLIDLIYDVAVKRRKIWYRAPTFVADLSDTFVLGAVLGTRATALVTHNTVDFTGSDQFIGAPSWNVTLLTPCEYLDQLD